MCFRDLQKQRAKKKWNVWFLWKGGNFATSLTFFDSVPAEIDTVDIFATVSPMYFFVVLIKPLQIKI